MAELYNHKVVEKKWQKVWDDEKAFAATNDFTKPKYYALVEFPYPSGQGLHVGHPRPYTALDIVARKRRMQGYNVLYPMGWDAFGLPTENYAIKNQIHPNIVTEKNVARFKDQLHSLGYSFDWDREINTTDPNYYKWTQWIFLKLFKAGCQFIHLIYFTSSLFHQFFQLLLCALICIASPVHLLFIVKKLIGYIKKFPSSKFIYSIVLN